MFILPAAFFIAGYIYIISCMKSWKVKWVKINGGELKEMRISTEILLISQISTIIEIQGPVIDWSIFWSSPNGAGCFWQPCDTIISESDVILINFVGWEKDLGEREKDSGKEKRKKKKKKFVTIKNPFYLFIYFLYVENQTKRVWCMNSNSHCDYCHSLAGTRVKLI